MLRTRARLQQVVALLHLVHGPGEDGLGLLHVGDDRVHQVRHLAVLAQLDAILGSIMIILTSSGRRVISMLRMMAFMHTDLPVPVLPAMSRCGMSARS